MAKAIKRTASRTKAIKGSASNRDVSFTEIAPLLVLLTVVAGGIVFQASAPDPDAVVEIAEQAPAATIKTTGTRAAVEPAGMRQIEARLWRLEQRVKRLEQRQQRNVWWAP